MARRRPRSHSVFFGITLVLALTLFLLTALPRLPDGASWRTFAETNRDGDEARAATTLHPDATWLKSATLRTSLGRHTRFVQMVGGRPVLGSWGVEHVLSNGERRRRGRFVTASPPDCPPADDPRVNAAAAAWLGPHELRAPGTVTRALRPERGGLTPVAVVLLPTRDPLGDWRIVVDERTDRIVEAEDILSLSGAVGTVFTHPPAPACPVGLVTDALLEPFVETVDLDALDGSGFLDGTYTRVTNGALERAHEPGGAFRYVPSQDGFTQVTAYHAVTRYFRYMESIGVTGYAGPRILVDARGYAGDNSFFSPATGRISLGVGGVPDGQDPEIVWHELGHALHHRALPSYAETKSSRAVSEGVADYLACSFSGDPLLAEWDASAYSNDCPPFLRRLDTPRHYPEDVSGQLHADGVILASALWSLRAELGQSMTDRIVLEGLFFLSPDSDLLGAANTFVETSELVAGASARSVADDTFARFGFDDGATPSILPAIAARVSPNPFRTQTTIRYSVSSPGRVRVTIHDVSGRLVRRLVDRSQSGGGGVATWDGRDDNRRSAPAGVYVYRVAQGSSTASGKLVRLP